MNSSIAPNTSIPLVSIVTPVLNRAGTIGTTLASVAAQRHPRIEHIVVDGGSTDGTLESIRSFRSPHELRWISEPDGGMYEAINKGLALARGDILGYLNSDDLYMPWAVDRSVAALVGGSDLVYGDLGIMTRHASGASSLYLQFYPPFSLNYYTHFGTLGQPTVFWRRALTARIGEFDAGYRLLGDCEYWLRAATEGAILRHVAEITALQVEHDTTLRAVHPERLQEEFHRLRARYGELAGPPKYARLRAVEKSVRWRLSQAAFRTESLRRAPKKWSHFISFLREHEVEINRQAMLLFLLPGRYRSPELTWVNAGQFESELASVLGETAATG